MFICKGTMMPPSTIYTMPIYNVCPLHTPQKIFPACKFYSLDKFYTSPSICILCEAFWNLQAVLTVCLIDNEQAFVNAIEESYAYVV